MYCRNCGQQIDDKAAICVHCGVWTNGEPKSQETVQQPQINIVNTNTNTNTNVVGQTRRVYSTKSKWVAFFLCLFLGYFGVHRFYVGKIGTGLLWLFTGGMFGIGWIIDIILILANAFDDSNHCPLR